MASVRKCDQCGAIESDENRVQYLQNSVLLYEGSHSIHVKLPYDSSQRDLCEDCVSKIIKAAFLDLFALIAPYKPARMTGLVQGGAPKAGVVGKRRLLLD